MSVDLATARGELEQKQASLGASNAELASSQMQLNGTASKDEKDSIQSRIDGLKQKVVVEKLDVNEATAGLRTAESCEQRERLKTEEQERDKEIKEQEKAKAQEEKNKEDAPEIKEPQTKTKKDKVVFVGGEDFSLSEKSISDKKDPDLIRAELLKQIQDIAGKTDIEEKGPKAPVIAGRAAETVAASPTDPNIGLGISSNGDAKAEKAPIIKSSAGAGSTNT